MASSAWFNPAGGLRYHARALLGARLWAPFRAALSPWLASFEPSSARAVLVGPSAAYCFSDAFLCRFSELTLLEPDPLAGYLLARRLRRLGRPEPRIERRDELIAPLLEGTSGLAERLRADPRACLVFGNVLGQTRFLLGEADFLRFKAAFRERISPLLAGRAWLSFHDRVSSSLAPSFEPPWSSPARLTDEELLRLLYRADARPDRAELLDHASDGFFPSELAHHYFSWQIERQRHHLIEGVSSSSGT